MGKEISLSDSMEDYLEAISILDEKKKYVRVRDIAKYMKVRMSSVTGALKLLTEKKLVHHEKYEYVELTEQGKLIAREVRRRHDAVMKFLTEVLQIDPRTADKDACGIEHAISATTLDRLLKMIECLQECPKGTPECMIRFRHYAEYGEKPPVSCEVLPGAEYGTDTSLNLLESGTKARVIKVCGRGATRRRIMDMGIVPGEMVEVEREAPLGDPIEVKIKDFHLSLRKEEASNIFVEVFK